MKELLKKLSDKIDELHNEDKISGQSFNDLKRIYYLIEEAVVPTVKETGIIVMPDDINIFNSSTDRCDMLLGPCACGAYHKLYEQIKKIVIQSKIEENEMWLSHANRFSNDVPSYLKRINRSELKDRINELKLQK